MYNPALKIHYLETVVPKLIKSQGYRNKHQVPNVVKVVINSGISASNDKAHLESVVRDIALIAGQKPIVTKARRSISNFKVRAGMPVGVKVTLRGSKMHDFLLRLINIALPEMRDFRGLSNKMDGQGNYTVGIADHAIFPEIAVDGSRNSLGMDITIVTSADTDDEGRDLLALLGMPFRKVADTGL